MYIDANVFMQHGVCSIPHSYFQICMKKTVFSGVSARQGSLGFRLATPMENISL